MSTGKLFEQPDAILFCPELACQVHTSISSTVLLGHLGQLDFPSGQVTFDFHLPDEQGIRQVICQLNH